MTEAKTQTVEELEQELASLEHRRDQALQGAEENSRRLEEIGRERYSIATKVFEGDPDATEQMGRLEKDSERLVRHTRLARQAAEQREEDIAAAKEELTKAQQAQAREEYEEMAAEEQRAYKVFVEKLAEAKRAADEHVRLHAEGLGPANRIGDTDLARRIAGQNPRNKIGRKVHDKFREYLR